jgi:hypothetical protein
LLTMTLKPVEMNEYNRHVCLPNTRLDVIKSIIAWITDESTDRESVLWLSGLAGTGKSTLSTTIAWMMRDLGHLGGFFFFDRDIPERDAGTLIRTLAYQLALFDAHIGDEMSRIVENIPRIAEMPLDFQFTNLLSKTLERVRWFGGPILLVIDALDECLGGTHRRELLQALSTGFQNLPPFIRVMVVSRQEDDLQHTLGYHSAVYQYRLGIDSATDQEDISQFIRYRLDHIRMKTKYLPLDSDWPSHDKINALTKSACGLFVWASVACSYIDSYDPGRRLNELISQQSYTTSGPFAALGRLYKTCLQSAGTWDDALFRSDFCNILGAILCARTPLSCSMVDSLLVLPRPSRLSISRLENVLHLTESDIRILHPSFHDYLSKQCSTEPWSIDLEEHNEKLAVHCIQLLDTELKENICALTLPHLVGGRALPEAVSYACKFWVEHICSISRAADDIGNRIYTFLCQHLLHWMEAMAVLKSHDVSIRSLQNLAWWLKVCCPTFLLDTCN